MKNLFKYYLMAMAAVLTVSLASCNNDDELFDIEDEEETLDPNYNDCEITIVSFDTEGTEAGNDPADELMLTDKRFAYVTYSKAYEASTFHAYVRSTDGDLRGNYLLYLCIEDNFRKLKSGDEIKDFNFGLNWFGSSKRCYSADEDHEYKMAGAIRVEKRFKNSVILNFENFSATVIHFGDNQLKVFTIKGRMRFSVEENSNN